MSKLKVIIGFGVAALGLSLLGDAKQAKAATVPTPPEPATPGPTAAPAAPRKKSASLPKATPAQVAAMNAANLLTEITDYARDIRILAEGIKAAVDADYGNTAKMLDDKRKQLEAAWRAKQGA
jgi:hypothetical protein